MRVAELLVCLFVSNAVHGCAAPHALGKAAHERDLGNGFHVHRASRPDGSTAIVYSNRARLDRGPPRPALVVASGSGSRSVFTRRGDGSVRQGFPGFFLRAVGNRYTILVLEKRGVQPLDTGDGALRASAEYHAHATRPGRVAEMLLLLQALPTWESVDPGRIVLAGHSEGTDVVAGAAHQGNATHVGFFSGGGPTQMFDFVLMLRQRLADQPPEAVEKKLGDLMSQFRDVFADPESTTKMMYGHPYKRWAGFFRHPAVEDLLRLQAPLFVAHGSADVSVPIASADYIEVEFIRHGKTNLTFKRYAGLDHNFRAPDGEDGMPTVINDFLQWIESPGAVVGH